MAADRLVEKVAHELQGRLPMDKQIDDAQKSEIRSLADAKLKTLQSKDMKEDEIVEELVGIFIDPPRQAKQRWWLPLAVGGGAALLTALGGPLVLGLAGFGSAGIVAGSAAAAWQASIGNVAAGSLFALLQSCGAAGIGAVAPTVAGAGAAGATAAAMAAQQGRS
ncbi:hypothetical protein DUNSADRAFT_12817 [Dunaliella salina]|uniref:Uncharacterized protein n=1 Tax=Dunaliella salina TaxID=3046 RepID=A0ABQ7H9R2_DUNSA|nr:hypothetical protein DUNSADRAFT_12817 [Dunaliella salina]|eukprot:KAF5843555.1 hypothetical protein DUNSADRAFT_12817 [Dunaliella salina]